MDGNSGDGRGGRWARECDSCRSAACVVYCQADMAYLCTSCDWRVHAANRVASRHDRVWVCEACERSPAAVTCKADAAVLCTACDADIHSVNPLARRHHRVPILPITGGVFGPRAAHLGSRMMMVGSDGGKEDRCAAREVDEEDAASWLVLNGVKKSSDERNEYVGGGEVDEYLDLVDYNGNYNYNYNSCGEDQYYNQQQQKKKKGARNEGSEGVVPLKCVEDKEQLQLQQNVQLEFEVSNSAFSYTASVTHSVSMSEASLVPDTTMTDISNSHNRPPKGTIDLFLGNPVHMAPQFTPMDREARVLRYREKKKTRKFEKTIRYASRKAYAETRPRIKGRFAKRTDVEIEADQMFSASVMAESGYSIISLF